jgi:hypothetical protein
MVHPPTPAGTQICSTGRAVVANFDPMLSLTPVEWNHPLRVIDAIKLSQVIAAREPQGHDPPLQNRKLRDELKHMP